MDESLSEPLNKPRLYSYFRSTASYRVRIALALKGIAHDAEYVHLGGDQFKDEYAKINPQSLVPTLVTKQGQAISQSMSILEYLEETHPEPSLLPDEPENRAWVRSVCAAIACEIHPLNNLRVLQHLDKQFQIERESVIKDWYFHWLQKGLTAVETMLGASPKPGQFCYGDTTGMADIFLVAQLFNARRFKFPLDNFPESTRLEANCLKLSAFEDTHPDNQPDAK